MPAPHLTTLSWTGLPSPASSRQEEEELPVQLAQEKLLPGKRPAEAGYRVRGRQFFTERGPARLPRGCPASLDPEHLSSNKSTPVPDMVNEAEPLSKEGTHRYSLFNCLEAHFEEP